MCFTEVLKDAPVEINRGDVMAEETFRYYVIYDTRGNFGSYCYEAVLDHPLDTFVRVLALASEIQRERNVPEVYPVVITGWERLQ